MILLGARAGLGIMALSDHDTAQGVDEAMAQAAKLGVICLPAIEISTYDNREIHILGYNIDYKSNVFMRAFAHMQELRAERISKMISKLSAGGYDIGREEVFGAALGSVSRQHIAKMLVSKGYFPAVKEAYSLIREGAPFYVPHCEMLPADAIGIIRQSGGQAVLAHPGRLELAVCEREGFVRRLTDFGLNGIESGYKAHTKPVAKFWSGLAAKYGLFDTAGGDNHLPDIDGFVLGELT